MTEDLSRGAKLKRARIERGWSVEKVAAELKLAPKQVVAIEENDRAALPNEIYVKGFVRNYARVLARPLSDFEEVTPPADVEEVQNLPPAETRGSSIKVNEPVPLQSSTAQANRRTVIWAVLVVVLGVAGASIQPDQIEFVRQALKKLWAPKPTPSAEIATAPVTPVQPLTPASEAQSPAPEPAKTVAEPEPSASTPSDSKVLPSGSNTLELMAKGDSWVEVKSTEGALLFSGVLHEGERKTVAVSEGARLVIGNAPVLELTWRGRKLDLVPFTRDVVARVTLNAREP